MKRLKVEIIAMILLWINVIVSGIINPGIFDPLFSLGMIGLLSSSILYLKYRDYSLIILLVILFLGSFNIVRFSNFLHISIVYLNIPIAVLFTLVLYRRYYELKDNFSEKTYEDYKEERNKKIDFFKNKFQNLSVEELENNLKKDHLVYEAKIAIRSLLKAKNL